MRPSLPVVCRGCVSGVSVVRCVLIFVSSGAGGDVGYKAARCSRFNAFRCSMKNCGTTVQNALRAVEGVTFAEVNFEERLARVRGAVSADVLIEAVEDVGFGAEVASDGEQKEAEVTLSIEGMMW